MSTTSTARSGTCSGIHVSSRLPLPIFCRPAICPCVAPYPRLQPGTVQTAADTALIVAGSCLAPRRPCQLLLILPTPTPSAPTHQPPAVVCGPDPAFHSVNTECTITTAAGTLVDSLSEEGLRFESARAPSSSQHTSTNSNPSTPPLKMLEIHPDIIITIGIYQTYYTRPHTLIRWCSLDLPGCGRPVIQFSD